MNNLQQKILEIFKMIDTLCQAESIRYFAIGGTAIGAARHKGFVPWDDDLDIAMPIEDYLRFLEIAPKTLPDGYSLLSHRSSTVYNHAFCKVVDERTTFIEESELAHPGKFKGVWVDVMPLGGIPTESMAKDKYLAELKTFRRMVSFSGSSAEEAHGAKDRLKKILTSIQSSRKSRSNIIDEWLNAISMFPFDSSDSVGYVWNAKIEKGFIFPKTWFNDYVLLPFEDGEIRCPVCFDKYLTAQFGDYMTIPNVEGQEKHSGFIDLEHSYHEYANGQRKLPSAGMEGK